MVMAAVFEQGKRKGKRSDGLRNLPIFYFFAYWFNGGRNAWKCGLIKNKIGLVGNWPWDISWYLLLLLQCNIKAV